MGNVLTEAQIFNMKMAGDIFEFEGYDVFSYGFGLEFKEDVKCDKCGQILKKGKEVGDWYIPVRHPNKLIIKWACGCVEVKDMEGIDE